MAKKKPEKKPEQTEVPPQSTTQRGQNQEVQRLTREATKSRPAPLAAPVNSDDNGSPQPGTEDVPL